MLKKSKKIAREISVWFALDEGVWRSLRFGGRAGLSSCPQDLYARGASV